MRATEGRDKGPGTTGEALIPFGPTLAEVQENSGRAEKEITDGDQSGGVHPPDATKHEGRPRTPRYASSRFKSSSLEDP